MVHRVYIYIYQIAICNGTFNRLIAHSRDDSIGILPTSCFTAQIHTACCNQQGLTDARRCWATGCS